MVVKWISLSKNHKLQINAADARTSRFTGGEKVDVAIQELDMKKRRATLSMRLLEEIEKKEALDKYGSEGSGTVSYTHLTLPTILLV